MMRSPHEIAAGVVAAVRRLYSSSVLPPAQLRAILQDTAEPKGGKRFDEEYGYGVINVGALLDALEKQVKGVEGAKTLKTR